MTSRTMCVGLRYQAMRAAGPHSEEMDPELRTVMLGGREEEAAPASGMSLGQASPIHMQGTSKNVVV